MKQIRLQPNHIIFWEWYIIYVYIHNQWYLIIWYVYSIVLLSDDKDNENKNSQDNDDNKWTTSTTTTTLWYLLHANITANIITAVASPFIMRIQDLLCLLCVCVWCYRVDGTGEIAPSSYVNYMYAKLSVCYTNQTRSTTTEDNHIIVANVYLSIIYSWWNMDSIA